MEALQLDTCNPDKGGSQLVNHGSSGSKSHSVVRRYEFYKYTGPVVALGGDTSDCAGGHGGGHGGDATRISTDDEALSACPRDPDTNDCLAPGDGELGDFIGAQNVAQNLALNDGALSQTIDFAALGDLTHPAMR